MSNVGGAPDELPGGWSAPRTPTAEDQKIADKVKPQFFKWSGVSDLMFMIDITKDQKIVDGTNFLFKVDYGDDKYAHIMVFEDMPHTKKEPTIKKIVLDKKKEDELEPF
ncbi:cystatin-B-like [Pyxicephalus adspersus]|uniref:cystatin-B-like n=1 Tax=Pyxicephalus adspersus TaxID=30357 RepID=UPI003B59421D